MVDAQSGHEKTLTGLMPALAGANLIYGLGMIESGMTFDFGQLVMDDEFAGMIKQCVRGIRVDDEALARGRDRRDRAVRRLPQPRPHDGAHAGDLAACASSTVASGRTGTRTGALTIQDRALAKARKILETHEPDPLPDGVAEELAAIIRGAERELGVA